MTDNDNKHRSLHGYDFGDENEPVLPDDAQFDAWVSGAAASINVPSAAPRAEMWSDIAARVAQQKTASAEVRPIRRSRFFVPLALAAALVLGIAIDRFAVQRQPVGQSASLPVKTTTTTTDSVDSPKLYRMAAQQTLTQAEALLTAYRASNLATRDPESVRQLGTWGRQVLSSTRLLIDSPAGDDPRLKPLLEDLEVVLVQIIRLSGAALDQSERDLIDGAITNRHLLPRIRSAVPAGSDAATD